MAVVATVGGKLSNSFVTIDEFDDYLAQRVPALPDLLAATDLQKEAMLVTGTNILNACFDWTGSPTDPSSDDAAEHQALTWPRTGMASRNGFTIAANVLPRELKQACCELAAQAGAGDLLADNDAAKLGISSVKAGDVAVSFQSKDTASVDSVDMALRRMGSEFLYVSDSVPQAVRMLLVPTWYKQPSIKKPGFLLMLGGRY